MANEQLDESHALRSTTRLFVGQVLSVALIATALTAVGILVKRDDTTRTQTGRPMASASPLPETTSAPPATTPQGSPSSTAPESPSLTSPQSTPAEDRPFVDVVNQSAPDGAAQQVAERIEIVGWRIGRVDDFRGNVRTTTVYFFPGDRKHARALADELGGIRVLPAFDTLVEDRLTVVLVEPIG